MLGGVRIAACLKADSRGGNSIRNPFKALVLHRLPSLSSDFWWWRKGESKDISIISIASQLRI